MRSAPHRCLVVSAALLAVTVLGCGGDQTPTPGNLGPALQTRGGAYVDGTGRLGLAVLATLRDAEGAGLSEPWTGTLSGPYGAVGGTITYLAPGAGSWAGAWWPEEVGYAGDYSLSLAPESGPGLEATFQLDDGQGIAPAEPTAADGGDAISWPVVPGAASYECRVFDDAGLAKSVLGSSTSCDLSALGAGAYAVSVLAYSADLAAIAGSGDRLPALPDRFDVSEARLAIARTDGSSPVAVLAVAGGAYDDGTSLARRGLAVWVSILAPGGGPTTSSWTIEVIGPALPRTAPLTFTYPANFSRLMIWSEAVPAASGSYGVIARSASGTVARSFVIGAPATIDAPNGISASAGAQGSASASWTPVAGAASYLVSARSHATGSMVMSQWVAGASASFPAGTFVADQTYDVYVAATDADMAGGAAPTEFAITENGFQPASFVGR